MGCEGIAKIGKDELLFGGWWEGFGCLCRPSQMRELVKVGFEGPFLLRNAAIVVSRVLQSAYLTRMSADKMEMAWFRFLRVTLYERAE